jgi:hypothetical protein
MAPRSQRGANASTPRTERARRRSGGISSLCCGATLIAGVAFLFVRDTCPMASSSTRLPRFESARSSTETRQSAIGVPVQQPAALGSRPGCNHPEYSLPYLQNRRLPLRKKLSRWNRNEQAAEVRCGCGGCCGSGAGRASGYFCRFEPAAEPSCGRRPGSSVEPGLNTCPSASGGTTVARAEPAVEEVAARRSGPGSCTGEECCGRWSSPVSLEYAKGRPDLPGLRRALSWCRCARTIHGGAGGLGVANVAVATHGKWSSKSPLPSGAMKSPSMTGSVA